MKWQKNQKKLIFASVLFLFSAGLGSAFFFFFKASLFSTLQGKALPERMSYGELLSGQFLEKVAKVVPAQEILVASEANGKLKRVLVQEGELVNGGQPLAFLDDVSQNYALQVEQAKKQLDQALQAKEQGNFFYQEQLKLAEQKYLQAQNKFADIQLLFDQAIEQEKENFESLHQDLITAEQLLKASKLDYEQIKNREQYSNSDIDMLILNAKNTYETALKEYANLTIRSPITAKLAKILVREGDLLAKGMPIALLKTQEVQGEFLLSADEYVAINEKSELKILKDQDSFTGIIKSIEPLGVHDNQFKVKIGLPQEFFQEGEILKIQIPFSSGQAIFPLKNVKLLSPQEGEIPILSGGEVVYQKIKISKIIPPFLKLQSLLGSDFSFLLMDFSEENHSIFEQEKY